MIEERKAIIDVQTDPKAVLDDDMLPDFEVDLNKSRPNPYAALLSKRSSSDYSNELESPRVE